MLCGPLAVFALVAATSVMDVADPRPAHHVVDLTGTLSAADIAAIDASAQQASAAGELVVVVVDSTDGANPRQWTTAYFNRLRLDTRARNRGVVLMAALKDRKAEIVVGEGFPGAVTSETDAIISGVVVAHFKRGDPRGAMVQGARAIAARVLASPVEPVRSEPVNDATSDPLALPVMPVVEKPPPAWLTASTQPDVLKVPDPRATPGAVDRAKLLTPAHQQSIAQWRKDVQGIEILVVTQVDTGKLDTATFARGLAHRLGLSEAAAPSGRAVLVFVVANKKRSEIEIVSGAALPADVVDGARIMATWRATVASNRKLRGAATAEAALALVQVGSAVLAHEEQRRVAAAAEAARREAAHQERLAAMRQQQLADQAAFERDDVFFDDDNPFAWMTGLAGLFGVSLGGREVLRRRPRSCKKCKIRMHRLAEELDDKHLQEGEKTEERLGSVDYDVWACGQCGDVLKTRWGAIFTGYSRCGGCSWKTMSSTSRTITSATTHSTGLAEVTEDCKHCSYHRTYTRVIPRVQKSSSSSSSSGRGGGGGGGFSSGRGSSGSW